MISHDADSVRGLAINLANDHFSAQLVAGLRARQTRPILLKGASVRRMLYSDAEARVSNDIDLLVEERQVAAVESALPDLGFRYLGVTVVGSGRPRRRTWVHEQTGLPLELHTSITGIGAPPDEVWAVLSSETEVEELCGRSIEMLNRAARVMHVALNVAHHGRANVKTMADLERALTRVQASTWLEAAGLAKRLDALPAFAAGLRLQPEGVALLDELGANVPPTAQVALRAETAPPLSQGLAWLAQLPSTRARLRFMLRTAFPPPDFMRVWTPTAQRGFLGLFAAYCWRPIWMAAHLVPAVRAWRRASRSVKVKE